MKTSPLLILILITACSEQPTYRADRSPGATEPKAAAESPQDQGSSSTENEKVTPPRPAPDMNAMPAPAPAQPAARLSQGSGGGTGLLEIPFADSTGLASTYRINAPADAAQKVYGLHIHLHGDGGGGYRDFPNREARYDLIGVSVKAPNTNLQWGRAQGRAHAFYVNELLQKELVKKYNVDLDRIYFSGVSGGAYFLMGSFLPEFGAIYNSAAFVLCGSEPPRVAFTDPKMLGKFRIHIEVTAGERPDILSSIQNTVTAYKNAMNAAGIAADQQAKLQTLNIQGAGGHCVFDEVSYTSGIQQAIDTKFKMVLPP